MTEQSRQQARHVIPAVAQRKAGISFVVV